MAKKKVVLITGASAGIGKETALYLAGHGYVVYGAARRTDKMSDLVEKGIRAIPMDVTDEDSINHGFAQLIEREGRIDVLVNNAGFGSYGAVEDVTIPDAKYQMDVNVFGAARLIKKVLPYMRAQRSGKIVNISSIGGKIATPFGGWYHASKFALEGLSDSLRNEVRPFGIDVIVIEPGGIKSEWSGLAFDSLIKVSGKTAYKEQAGQIAGAFQETEGNNPGPILIAELILKAIETRQPKARYSAGYMAKPALFMRKILSDSMFDKMTMSQVRRMSKSKNGIHH
jgi:NAD(P)-dependent dehydrogenase (short-subunit alcohol dehydrogenase family)